MRRHPVVAALSAAVALSLVVGLAATLWQWQNSRAHAEAATRANYAASLGVIKQRLDEGNYVIARQMLFGLPQRCRNWEWGRLLQLAHQELIAASVLTNGWTGYLDRDPAPVTSLAVWDGRNGALIQQWNIPRENEVLPVQSLFISPDGRSLAALGFSAAGVWAVDTGQRLARFNPPGANANEDAVMAGFSEDGRRLATVDRSSRLRFWNTADWSESVVGGANSSSAAIPFSADGRRLFVSASQMISPYLGEVSIEVLDGETGGPIVRLDRHSGWGSSIAYHSGRRQLLHTIVDPGSPARGVESSANFQNWQPFGEVAIDRADSTGDFVAPSSAESRYFRLRSL